MPARLRPDNVFGRIRVAITTEIQRAITDAISMAERAVKLGYTTKLHRRSGRLVSSVRREGPTGGPPPRPVTGRVFIEEIGGGKTNPVYARIHEKGGIIRPRTSQWLTIPLPAIGGGTAGGRPGRRVRDFPRGFFFRSRRGNLIFGERIGRDQLRPLFVLKRFVVITARPVWGPAAREIAPKVRRRFALALERALAVAKAA